MHVGCPPYISRPSDENGLADFCPDRTMGNWCSACLECSACHVVRARARLPRVLAAWRGRPFNTAAMGRELGVSRPTVVSYLRTLEREGRVTLLPFYGGSRRPLLSTGEAELTMRRIRRLFPEARFSWWKTGRVRRVELIADIGTERIGFCFSPFLRPRDWLPLIRAERQGVISRGYLLHLWDRALSVSSTVQALLRDVFLRDLESWIVCRKAAKDARREMRRINARLADVARAL
jgi:hypothetical protein